MTLVFITGFHGKHRIIKKGKIALNVGPFMSPVCCTIEIMAHLFSQIDLSQILWSQIKNYFKTHCWEL